MAEKYSKAELAISKAQRRYKVGYVNTRHINSKTYMTMYYLRHPSLHLKGNCLAEAEFETGRGVTVKVTDACIVLMADHNGVQELREQLYQAKQVVKGIKDGMFSVLNED